MVFPLLRNLRPTAEQLAARQAILQDAVLRAIEEGPLSSIVSPYERRYGRDPRLVLARGDKLTSM